MEKKFEKLSPAEVGIIAFMALVLVISIGASWYKDSQTVSKTTSQQQVVKEDPNYKAAENAVIELEGNQTKEKLEAAQAAVDKLTDIVKKQELQTRINQVKVSAANLTDAQTKAKLKAELIRAEAAKKLEEQKKASSSSSVSSSLEVETITTETSTVAEETSNIEETYQDVTYQEETYEYVAPSQNTYIAPPTTYTPQASQSVTTPPLPSSSTIVESSNTAVSETTTTDASSTTEVSTDLSSSTDSNPTSSVDNP
ncbi:serine protease [Streptococcus suis]|nr:serine protease [Streptococcus suis]NQO84640.1 serine protease [Streptococcus suis]HEM5490302.1 serine protease [Streptococcus suis]